jgi:hypothetical protein
MRGVADVEADHGTNPTHEPTETRSCRCRVKSVNWQNQPPNQPLRYWFVSIRDALYCSESEPA